MTRRELLAPAAAAGPLVRAAVLPTAPVKSLWSNLVFENTNAIGSYNKYARFPVPGTGYIFPAFDFNGAFGETDVFMSMAKLKNHASCAVTLSMKNCFGNTRVSIYGDDARLKEPNESPDKGRLEVCHSGKRQPSTCSPAEIDSKASRSPEYCMPRIVGELNAARPVDIAFINGIETATAITTDAVAIAVMGYDPQASRGTTPFEHCDNHLKLAEAPGVCTCDLKRIDVVGGLDR